MLPIAGIFLPWIVMVALSGTLAAASLGLDLTRINLPFLNRYFLRWLSPFLKKTEDRRVTGATYMLVATVVAFLVFEQHIAVVALLFLAIGDPMAALVGMRTPGPRVLGKSPGGTLAFVGVSLLVVLALEGSGLVPFHWAYAAGAVIAAAVELAPIPLDDNLTVPLLTGTAMQLMVVWI
jgi:dolichol kinase